MNIRYGQFCPVAKAAEVLGERWTILIIRELLLGSTRFSDLQRALSQISPTLLTRRLGQLQDCGLLIRKQLPKQKRTECHLAPAGRELLPVVLGLGEWGMKWARGQMTDDELDVELLMHDISRRIDTEAREATKDGRLRLEGDAHFIRTLSSWLRASVFAGVRPQPDGLKV